MPNVYKGAAAGGLYGTLGTVMSGNSSYNNVSLGGLSKLERLILNTVRNEIDSSMIELWDRQLQAINKIQRLPGGVEVNFYRMKNGRPTFDGDIAFPNKSDEYEIAKVYIKIENSSMEVIASLWCVKGFLFSIEYTNSADYFEEVIAMDPMPEISIKCVMNRIIGVGYRLNTIICGVHHSKTKKGKVF